MLTDMACLFLSPSQQHYGKVCYVTQSAVFAADNKIDAMIHSLISR